MVSLVEGHQDVATFIQQHGLDQTIESSGLDLLHAVTIALTIALFLRTAAGTKGSRFLRHLAGAHGVTLAYYTGRVVVAWLIWVVTHVDTGQNTSMEARAQAGLAITNGWDTIDSVLSFFNSFWLFLVGDLLSKYPNEGIDRQRYGYLVTILGVIWAGLFVVATANKVDRTAVLWLDAGVALAMIWYVGFELYRFGARARYWRIWLPVVTGFGYFAWGALQIGYAYYSARSIDPPRVYWWLMLGSKLICGLLTVVLSAAVLEEKEKFASPPGRRSR